MLKIKLFILIGVLCALQIGAQENLKWNVSDPTGDWDFKEMDLSTDEGTWMSLDVSPDGKEIVFDLLGDIYKMPISGGKATILREGLPFEVQPRFSPDGSKILFTSDAGGGDNIWIMNANGANAIQVTKENFRLLNNGAWSADGNYIVARKHFTSGRSLGAGEMWMYHISGGSGTQLTKRKNDQQDVNEPVISADGKYMYYSEDVYPGGSFQYNKDPNKQIYAIKRYDFESGEISTITGGPGGAARPQISRDGKKLAFVRRVRAKTVLFIHDLETNEEWPIYDALNKDQQEAWAIFGIYPNFSWTPDDTEIVFWSGGKIKKIHVSDLTVSEIPFQANATIKIAKALEFDTPAFTEEFTSKVIRNAITSPDGKMIAFNALGYVYTKSLPNGKSKRLTIGTDLEAEPNFSPDGNKIVFTTWNDEQLGAIHTISKKGGISSKITIKKGIYRTPAFSPDGNKIVFQKESGNSNQGKSHTKKSGIYTMNSDGSNMNFVSKDGAYPRFDKTGERIFIESNRAPFGGLVRGLKSIDLNGENERAIVKSKYATRFVASPDNNWIAFINLHKVYIAPMPMVGKTIDLDVSSKAVPISQLSKDAGLNLHWSEDSEKVYWTLGDEYFENKVAQRFTFLETSPDSIPPIAITGLKINLTAKSDKPKGKIAFRGARIITMEGAKVIERGTIVIDENRIVSLGKVEDITIPKNAKIYEVDGKTIMPGIVDAHAHVGGFRHGLTAQKHWQLYANLAFGVTTSHDPSANSESIFTLAEMIKNGEMVGPRLYSTGTILYGAEGNFKAVVNSLEDARSSIRRTKAFGALSVKSYNQPRREQRQQIIQAAREEEIFVVPEGGSTFFHNMSMIMDGHTGIEHNIPVAPVYKDVLKLWGTSNTGYTPTLIVNYGGLNGEFYWYQNSNVWENEKLLKYTPRGIVDARSRHRTMVPEEEYQNGHILVSQTCKQLLDAGVKVNLGAHGQIQGIGAHWELWMLQQGGMTNLEALRAATQNGADYIGIGHDIGSLKEGKLADLIVLDKNPLENIQNTNSVKYTMVNGRLYDTETMNEIGNSTKVRSKFYWENTKYNASFEWHDESESFALPGCGCHIGH